MRYNYQDAPRESQQEYFGKVHTDNKETLYNALKRIEELEKKNEKLDKQIDTMLEDCKRCTYRKTSEQLEQAKEIIKGLLSCCRNYPQENEEIKKLQEEILKEIEK